jgi:HAD superfamily hydrolase (TIGR01509 family)
MIKLIVFDLDGTLVNSKNMHYVCLNRALEDIDPDYKISIAEQENKYEGLPTKTKLEMLTKDKNLPVEQHQQIWDLKQKYTLKEIQKYQKDDRIITVLNTLAQQYGYKLYVATNCTRRNASSILFHKGFCEYMDRVVTRDDVRRGKPHPEIYHECVKISGFKPEEILVVEDTLMGVQSATQAGCYSMQVDGPHDVTIKNILKNVHKYVKLNIVIPMAGMGSRFRERGYKDPKPLIDVNGEPMISRVVKNIQQQIDICCLDPKNVKYIFIVQKEQLDNYDVTSLLPKDSIIIPLGAYTQGALCSVLTARGYIKNDTPLVIANSDQLVEWGEEGLFTCTPRPNGRIAVFTPGKDEQRWSYVSVISKDRVDRVAEKEIISNIATVGIYYYSSGEEFLKYARKTIVSKKKVNGEYYVCPVFNEYVDDGKMVKIVFVKRMYGLGTPDDLEAYLETVSIKM